MCIEISKKKIRKAVRFISAIKPEGGVVHGMFQPENQALTLFAKGVNDAVSIQIPAANKERNVHTMLIDIDDLRSRAHGKGTVSIEGNTSDIKVPNLSVGDEDGCIVSFREALDSVYRFTGNDSRREVLFGVHLSGNKVVASDGKCLVSLEVERDTPLPEVTIRYSAVRALREILYYKDDVNWSLHEQDQMKFVGVVDGMTWKLQTKCFSQKYPDAERVIEEFRQRIGYYYDIKVKALERALDEVYGKEYFVRVEPATKRGDGICLRSLKSTAEKFVHVDGDVSYTLEEAPKYGYYGIKGVNIRMEYLKLVVDSLPTGTKSLRVGIDDESHPLLIDSEGGVYVIMHNSEVEYKGSRI